jgi:hypothetical protein
MASITPVPAPPPGEPLDSANACVHSSTVEPWVVTASESAMAPIVPDGRLPGRCPGILPGGARFAVPAAPAPSSPATQPAATGNGTTAAAPPAPAPVPAQAQEPDDSEVVRLRQENHRTMLILEDIRSALIGVTATPAGGWWKDNDAEVAGRHRGTGGRNLHLARQQRRRPRAGNSRHLGRHGKRAGAAPDHYFCGRTPPPSGPFLDAGQTHCGEVARALEAPYRSNLLHDCPYIRDFSLCLRASGPPYGDGELPIAQQPAVQRSIHVRQFTET